MLQLFYILKKYISIFLAGTTIYQLRTRDASNPGCCEVRGFCGHVARVLNLIAAQGEANAFGHCFVWAVFR